MKNRRAVGLQTLCAIKIEGKNRGEEGTTPVTTARPEAGKYKCAENIYIYMYTYTTQLSSLTTNRNVYRRRRY